MNNKKLTKRASGLCLALMAGLFVLCTNTASFGQLTYLQQAPCFTLSTNGNQTSTCNGQTSCESNTCDHCVTFTMTNTSNNCDIQQITIQSADGTTCFSVCCPAIYGNPSSQACTAAAKTFTGTFGPTPLMPAPGVAVFTICYNTTDSPGLHKFIITETQGAPWGAGAADCCVENPPVSPFVNSAIVRF